MTEQTPTNKVYPLASPEVAKMFGLDANSIAPQTPASHGKDPSTKEGFTQIVGNLFVKDPNAQPHADSSAVGVLAHGPAAAHPVSVTTPSQPEGKVVNFLKTITPYVAVFSVALFVYFYFFAGNFDFGKILQSKAPQTPKQTQLSQLEQQDLAGYQKWMGQFYFEVSNSKVLDPDADNSGNGLTNFQKYLLNLNPKSYDTLGLGMADSQALEANINPLTGTSLTADQKAIIDKYFDFEVISNRLVLENLQKKTQVAGANTGIRGSALTVETAQAAGFANVASPEDLGNSLDIDTSAPGRLEIPSLKIDAPLIWSESAKNFDKDLQNGIIHYPGTAMPGQIGTSYISGHSSNYVWAKGDYNHIFTKLDQVPDNTSFTITVKTKDGHTSILHYVVTGRQQYSPNDQAQFSNGGKSVVALSTCWPVGSTKYRLVLFGQLTQVEKQS